MAKPQVTAAGGMAAILYVFRKGREAGGILKLYKRLRSKNACKTCALGMGGQRGGMVNEAGHFPEVCKKSVQAQAGDMGGTISESYFAQHSLARMERLTSYELERLGRVAFPLMAEPGDRNYRRVSWNEALDRAATALNESHPDQTFFYSSGRASNEAAFLMQLVARAYGTKNINNCSYYCHQASGAALAKVYGSGTASIVLEDLGKADFALVAGANPASNHPRLITQLVDLRRRGGRVVIINPLRELGLVRFRIPSDVRSMIFGSQVSDLYLQPHIGGDLALFKSVLKGLLEKNATDSGFIDSFTSNWEAVKSDIAGSSWDELTLASGVPRAQVDELVDMVAKAKHGIVLWAMGLTHHEHGVDSIFALANIALGRGWLGKPGAGFLPIRGHSNVQGVGSVGVTPELKASFSKKMEELYDIAPQDGAGLDTYASVEAAGDGKIKTALLLGGNLFASNPDRTWAARSMRKIGTTISLTTKLNEGHLHGRGQTSIILPVLARDEESQSTTQESMFSYVRVSEGGTPAVEGEMRSEVDLIASLAERILPEGRFDWSALHSHAHLRAQIAAVVPGYKNPAQVNEHGGEFQIEGRTLHTPRFSTPDGKAHFHVTPLAHLKPSTGEFRLMTLRSEGQFNTVVYEEDDLYRGVKGRDAVMMSAVDAENLGVSDGSRVVVSTEAGQLIGTVATVDIRPGNLAMYYPEANVLVPRKLDPVSRTPAFKSILARVQVGQETATSSQEPTQTSLFDDKPGA